MASEQPKKHEIAVDVHDARLNGLAGDSSKNPSPPSLFPDLDVDGDYVHFEMTPLQGDSMLWLTVRRGITPERAASSLRKIAGLIDRQGTGLLDLLEGRDEPLRLAYNKAGHIVVAGE